MISWRNLCSLKDEVSIEVYLSKFQVKFHASQFRKRSKGEFPYNRYLLQKRVFDFLGSIEVLNIERANSTSRPDPSYTCQDLL